MELLNSITKTDSLTAKNFQKIRVKLSKEECYQYNKLNFKATCLENLVKLLIRTSEDCENVDNLQLSFQKYADDLVQSYEELKGYTQNLVFKYAINVPSNRNSEVLKYMIYPEEQEIVYFYEV